MNLRHLVDKYFIKNPALRQRVTRLIEGDHDVTVQLLGSPLHINTVREHGYLRASRTGSWSSVFGDEAPVLMALASLLPHLDTIVDAGANVGLFSVALGRFQKLYPHLQIAAFEADPDTFTRLQRNLAGPHRQAHNVALSNTTGTLNFIRGAVSHVTTTVEQANAYSLGNHFSVECRRLDSFPIPGERILLKIDVEGQEWRVIEGAKQWFDDHRCVCVYLDGCENRDTIIQYLTHQGFEFRDGRTLDPATDQTFSLLALRTDWLSSFAPTAP